MNHITFWQIIEEALKNVSTVYDVAPVITKKLQKLPAGEIVSFMQHQNDLMSESYRHDLWAVAYIINRGCSDDCFEYFRGWLMANGQERWEAAMKAPESIGEWVNPKEFVYEYEDMLYVAANAFKAKTEQEFPYDKISINYPQRPLGKSWTEEELEKLYPDLNTMFT
ncbi:DUF4240 domain-containing protein [Candidatus Leptofilum sp.]|uniref:DUF4240 domain-containing protein n=1 Tax=Candidatus Leptofilum sp. TaxID=3241576 RepID=UPI003B59CB7D